AADASHDERAYARAVARRFETEHHEEVLEPKAADLVAAVVRAFDEPFADSSAIPTLAVAEAAARQLKVALPGIGGDEVFRGHARPRRRGGRRLAHRPRDLSPRRPADDGRSHDDGALPRAARAVLRPSADRTEPHDAAGDQARGRHAESAAEGRVRRRAAGRGGAAAQAGLHDSARSVAAHRVAPSARRRARARARARPRPLAPRGRVAARGRARRGCAHAQRPALDAARARAVDARVPRRARGLAARVNPLRALMVSDVSPLSGAGGGERMLWEHARGLTRRGHAVTVLGRAPDGAAAAALERHGVRVVLFAVGRRSRAGFVRDAVFAAREAARGVLAASGFDVVNVYQPLAGYGVLGLPAARRVPALYTFLSPAPLEYRA